VYLQQSIVLQQMQLYYLPPPLILLPETGVIPIRLYIILPWFVILSQVLSFLDLGDIGSKATY
jgi:hypothetical protein